MPALSREYRFYLALWRKALREGELEINCANRHHAVAMRQGMYRAIKPFRHSIENDNELFKAADKFVIYLPIDPDQDKDQPHKLVFRERVILTELEKQFTFSEEELLVGDERRMFDDVTALIEKTDPENVEKRSTPFYSRD